jgi:hypothetical protein
MIEPLEFIDVLRNSDRYIETIYMNGGCYQFHLVLKALYPEAIPKMVNMGGNCKGCDHVITQIGEKYYDIGGEFPILNYELYDIDDKVTRWSFWKNNGFCAECPKCEEPVFFNPNGEPMR